MKITNRRALYDYNIVERMEAGINLTGPEVKSVKGGHVDLTGSFVKILGSEAYLVNAKIFPYEYARPEDIDARRTRKLLLHKKELIAIKGRMQGERQIAVPLSIYTKHGLIKVEVGLARGKKKYEKKDAQKMKDLQREEEQETSLP